MEQEPGWYPDPFHREQDRFWNGRIWTPYARPIGSTDPTWPTAGRHAPESPDGPDAPGARPGETTGTPEPPAGPRRRASFIAGVAALALLIGGFAGVVVYAHFGEHRSAASEAITTAATTSLNEPSVNMSLQFELSGPGIDQQVTGTGAFDFANQTGTMTLSLPIAAQQSEQVLFDGQTVYVSLPRGVPVAPGKSWASEDIGQFASGSGGLGSGVSQLDNPGSLLQRLQSMGGTVTTLGSTTFDGTSVTEYSVAVPANQIEQNLGQEQVPSWLQQFASNASLPNVTMKVYVGPGNLLRAIDMSFSFSFAGQSLSEHLVMSFTNYGAPVSVTPPPASEVVPLSQLGTGGSGTGIL